MFRYCVAMILVLGPASAFTPTTLRPPQLGGAPMMMRPQRVAMLSQRVPQEHAAMMAAVSSPRTPAAGVSIRATFAMRLALAVTASLLGIFLRVGRAVAASASATSAAPFALSGNMVKWGVVTVVLGGAYIFRREETPILTETVIPEEEQPHAAAAASTDVDGITAAAEPAAAITDDASLNADLFRRMQALAAAKDAEDDDEGETPPPVSDSSDSWGVGNTAVLEPPRPGEVEPPKAAGVLDGEPAVDFPAGFPLVDGSDWSEPDTEPTASEDQIAMLQRMFGTPPTE
uniref:Transmembrane protein n=1 Tax=Haptolina brevifila TaxID=156173 RepID=A0A7S2D4H9_9EUKA|mmetsp:Transcript_32846/g.65365  ORF Transcript_32846/g.65365 Transcript_32846/m.65365 type:complete len:288 (+) Transcript_32846:50-913(+)